jgi:FAD-dependent sensor of blue light
MLVRLTYCSQAMPGTGPEDLQAILKRSRAHNTSAGITGVLCLTGGYFIQVLEGARAAVNALYSRLAVDGRHANVTLLAYEEILERRYAGWAMGLGNMARLNPGLLLKYCETATLDPYALNGRAVIALFDELVTTAAIQCGGG